MASVSRKYKEAQERWIQHCHDIERSTAKIPKGTEQERKDRIARARKDYRYFVRTYFPHLATTECADFQVDAAIYMRDHENARGLFEWARGHAKSTHISLLQPLWLKIQPNAQPLIMILVSKSQEAARRLLGDLQAELESNDLYNADFGNQRGAGIWTNGEFTTATGDLFIALGRGQSPRGIKKRGLRPNYIAVDDIDDDELVRNPRRVGEAVDWLLTALLGTMAMGRGRLAVVGNRIGRTSVIGTLADNPHFHHTVVNALDRKGLPSWPQNYTLREIAEDPLLSGRTLPTRLQVLAQHMARHGWATPSYPQEGVDHESEEGQEALLRNAARPSSESEAGPKPAPDGSLRIPKEDRTVRNDRINEVRTVPRAKSLQHLRLPERLLRLKDEQQSGAMVALQQVDESLRQAVLDEWDARCRNSAVRNPAGYLFGIIQKAIRGEFKAWAGESASTPPAPPSPAPSSPPASRAADPEVARAYLAQLREALRDR